MSERQQIQTGPPAPPAQQPQPQVVQQKAVYPRTAYDLSPEILLQQELQQSVASVQIEAKISSDSTLSNVSAVSPQSDANLPFELDLDVPLSKVLSVDKMTEDSFVPRDERLIRLTGSHPFNAEPPAVLSYEQGFITPSNLHYVRTHGSPLNVTDEEAMEWEISVEGLVLEPFIIKLNGLISEFHQYTTPVTLCCAGNRRMEQNMVNRGNGFNWYSNAVSNSLWTGPLLWDVIQRAKPHANAKFVCMEGADNPAKGHYGTSVPIEYVRDPERGALLAHKQNGIPLPPDHGRPLRAIIPGMIGGRSVKWLKRIILSDVPSNNWYHYYDNKVLPTMVTAETAAEEDHWWKDDRYTIYDLNLQSITVHPVHGETLAVAPGNEKEEYTIKGFAYNGGGKKVGRVEVSLDRGRSWRLCELDYPEDSYRAAGPVQLFGGELYVHLRSSYHCWCFWNINVGKGELKSAKDIVVRAMDISMTAQPRNMYWNVLSMLNNWWYRIAIRPGSSPDEIKFEHPVSKDNADGWMQRVKRQGGDLLDHTWGEDDEEQVISKVKKAYVDEDLVLMVDPKKKDRIVTSKEFQKHANPEDPWFIIKGHVFEGTHFLHIHPGGIEAISNMGGEDATDDFLAIHSQNTKKLIRKFHVGKFEKTQDEQLQMEAHLIPADNVKSLTLLSPRNWKHIKLIKREEISHDSRIFYFAMEHDEQTSGLPVGMHCYVRVKGLDGKLVQRTYTPLSSNKEKGVLKILMKIYFPHGDIPGGKLTMAIDQMPLGSQIEVKGPIGEFEYLGKGHFTVNKTPGHTDTMLFIGGGSGLTPCYQVIEDIVENEEDNTNMTFFYANKSESDILCRDTLDSWARIKKTLKVDYCISAAPEGWKGLTGRLDKERMDGYLEEQKKHGEVLVLICGPPGMVKGTQQLLEGAGIDPSRVILF